MRICYFGRYRNDIPRNINILRGLRLNNVDVKEVRFPTFRSKYIHYLKFILKNLRNEFDAFFIGYDRWEETIFSKISFTKPVIWDPLYSQFDAHICDRKDVPIKSFKAKRLFYRDLLALKFADCVLLDTNTHIEYFKELFPLKKVNYERIFVSADDTLAYPQQIPNDSGKFIVFFIGSYIPLHGIEHIIKAADELRHEKEILFKLVGRGQTFNYIKDLTEHLGLTNIEFLPPVPYQKAIELMNSSDISLGIFGTTRKAGVVIPSKVYDALATSKPIITRDSSAVREVLESGKNCLLCEKGNGKSLAEAILQLKDDKNLRKKIAANGHNLFKTRLSPKHIGRDLIEVIQKYVNSN